MPEQTKVMSNLFVKTIKITSQICFNIHKIKQSNALCVYVPCNKKRDKIEINKKIYL